MAVLAEQNVFGLQIPVNDANGVKVLEGDQHLGGVEPDRVEGEPVSGLVVEEGVEVAAGAIVDEEASVVGDMEVGVEGGEKRVVEGGEDVSLHLNVSELLRGESISVDDLEGEVGGAVGVAEATEEDAAEVTGAEVAEELEVAKVEGSIGGQGSGGEEGRPERVGEAVGTRTEGSGVGGCSSGSSGGGVIEAESEAGTSAGGGGKGAVGGGGGGGSDGGEAEIEIGVFIHGSGEGGGGRKVL